MRGAFRRISNRCVFNKSSAPITRIVSTPDVRPAASSTPGAVKSPPMNFYPSWIHRIPEMLEALALLPDERIDRRRAEELFDLRRSAAHELLRRLGAERCGNALAISRSTLIARLREAQEHPDWRWERERRQSIRNRIETHRNTAARSPQIPSASYSRVTESNGHSCEHGTSRLNTVLARSVHCCLPGHGAFGGTTGAGRPGPGLRIRIPPGTG